MTDIIHTVESFRKVQKMNDNVKHLFFDWKEKMKPYRDAIIAIMDCEKLNNPMEAVIKACEEEQIKDDSICQMWLFATVWEMLDNEDVTE